MGASNRKKIQDGIRALGKADAYEVYAGDVDSVDENNLTIDVKLNDDVIINDVRLKATIDDDKGEYVIPKKGSHVIIGQMDGGVEFCLLRASVITKRVFKIENTTFVADKDGIVMNGGNNKGLPILDKSVERWNKIEDDVNNLKQILQTVLGAVVNEPGNGAPSAFQTALKAALGSYYGQQLQKTTAAQIENDKVKH
jgi:hypothetical protein